VLKRETEYKSYLSEAFRYGISYFENVEWKAVSGDGCEGSFEKCRTLSSLSKIREPKITFPNLINFKETGKFYEWRSVAK
jgi:hypothetical protein